MIDTIVLLIDPIHYRILDPDKFTPSAHWVLNNNIIPGIQSKQNPTKRELRNGIYKPRLTIMHRKGVYGARAHNMLKIELSLPKLFFGNNFDELRYKDFNAVAHKLINTLRTMGVAITQDALIGAPITTIHYAKNMVLTDGSTPYHYIKKIKEAHVPLALDINQTDYRNSGHCYKLHSNAYEVVFYDKIKDLQKAKQSEKRAIEKDSALQMHLFDQLRTRYKKLEVLRMEVRLNKRQKIKQLFAQLGIKAPLTFKKLFKPAIAKRVLLHYVEKLAQKRPALLDYAHNNTQRLLIELITHNPDLKPNKVFQLLGLKKACEVMEPRELRRLFAKHNARSWQRLIAEAGKLHLSRVDNVFSFLRKRIEKFKVLRIKK